MGSSSSSLSELNSNEYLLRLSGVESLSPNDPFWNQLLSYSFQIHRSNSDQRLLEESTGIVLKNFAINNCRTGNFGSLVRVFLTRATELKDSDQCDDNIFTWQTYNALFIIRNITKYFIENLSEEVVTQQFDTKSTDVDGCDDKDIFGDMIEELIGCLMEILVDIPVLPYTYSLHLESLNVLLILLSIQMFHASDTTSKVYTSFMRGKCSIHACVFTKKLVQLFIAQDKCPADLLPSTDADRSGIYGITAAVASGFWNVVTLGMGGGKTTEETSTPVNHSTSDRLLANQSLLLILVLANHCTNERLQHNPYRQALFSFTNSQDQAESTTPTESVATFHVDYTQLYSTLCSNLHDDQTTLFLYLLLHRNRSVKKFILSRSNVEEIILPLLRILYNAPEKNSHHIYMTLIILLILSEDNTFNKAIHQMNVRNVIWFKERSIPEISLGGLLILVVIRTIQFNMTRMRDKYLHTNCLAAMANMSANFYNLHPYVTQRLVSLFALLQKKHSRLVEQIREMAASTSGSSEKLSARESGSEQEADNEQSSLHDLSALEEVIRMVLEIVNSCLTNGLHHNPNLVYTLLYQKELFTHFKTHPTFQDVIQNIDTVLGFFSSRIEPMNSNISVSEVIEIIRIGSTQFRRDRLMKFPELKFKYVEEDDPEEFFVPYVWSLVFHASNLYFNSSRIRLFSLDISEEDL